jgi:ABC-type bacteriocin/lantibiotic exporter with double-glycine peptidase domain
MKKISLIRVKFSAKINYIKYLLKLLTRRDKIEYGALTICQMLFSVLDILGIVAIGLLGSLTVNGIQSRPSDMLTQKVLSYLNLDGFVFQTQVVILGFIAGLVLISRTLLSILLTRRTLYFLGRRAAQISSSLADAFLRSNYEKIRSIGAQDALYAVTNGVNSLLTGVLGNLSTFCSDTFLLLVLFATLMVVDPNVALITAILFGGLALILYLGLQRKAKYLGTENAKLSIENFETILDSLKLLKEIKIRNLEGVYSKKIEAQRLQLSLNSAQSAFLPNISKYAIEIALVIGTLAIAALQFLSRDATGAISVLAIFLASGSRIAPAVLRLQQGAIAIKGATGAAGSTLQIMSMFPAHVYPESQPHFTSRENLSPIVEIEKVSFTYEKSQRPALENISISIPPGEAVAIIGPSGSGKSTLVNLILGILQPTHGTVTVSSTKPNDLSIQLPGYLGYVPQDIHFVKGTLRENLCLGDTTISEESLQRAVGIAQLDSVIGRMDNGLDSLLIEQAGNLSGGEKQRIGIARALCSQPGLIVLDEATSALDGTSEIAITEALGKLKGVVTTIVIAHRLTSVKECDRIIYLEHGKIVAIGTLNELRKKIPDLEAQLLNLEEVANSQL